MTYDVTDYMNIRNELKRSQEELQESEQRFRISFEQAPIGMEIIALDGKIVRANKAFCDMVLYTQDELQQMTFYDLTYPSDLASNTSAVRDMLEGVLDTVAIEKRYIRKDRQIIWVRVQSTIIRNNLHEPLYFISQVQDITKSREYEQEILRAKEKAEESDRLKSALLTSMSHELRTPLNGIMGFSELIKNSAKDPDIKDMTYQILKSGKRLMATLESVMMLAQLESVSKVPLNTYDYYNISMDLQNTLFVYGEEIRSKLLDVHINIQPNIFLRVEPKLFRYAVSQLIDNAIKFTNRGKIEITARTDANAKCVISISDTGIGIPEDKLKSIFEDFRQVSEGYGRAYEGSGLGLSITKRIANLFDSEILVESTFGKGSCFKLLLPYSEIFTQPSSSEQVLITDHANPEPKLETRLPEGVPTILVVEDNPVNQKLTTAFLKPKFAVDCVFNGESAIKKASEKVYTAILMDINLGSGMDGLQAARAIREIDKHKRTPIVAVTGYTMIGDRERILDGGCSHYIGKPFTKDELLSVLDSAISPQ